MAQICNEKGNILFEGNNYEMELAYKYLTQPFYILAETMGLKMRDAYQLNEKFWTDEAKKSKSFHLLHTKQ
jgi:hypothetical protein